MSLLFKYTKIPLAPFEKGGIGPASKIFLVLKLCDLCVKLSEHCGLFFSFPTKGNPSQSCHLYDLTKKSLQQMGKYSQLRKITQVFSEYGIVLTGARKHDHFIFDLQMDKIFLNGLIYELEYALNVELEDHKVINVDAPSQLIAMLLD